ncbi:MAG: LysR family transcriptional regulator [bacterium]|nr:LysR family transcriptional regulator [Acidimicrobiia bacterium]MCY4649405.1 LysR family transcriptional regulator [bacterium]
MDTPSLNFRSLRGLLEVEQRGSFTEAAWEMGISQPALSYSLAELSKRLGAPLFRKEGRRRVLTEAGERTARYADQVLGQTNDLLRWLESWEQGEVGTLRVGMIDTAGLYTLPAGLSRLREEHASIDLQLVVADSAELLSMLDGYRIDLAFVVGPAGHRYNSTPITTERMHIYSPGSHHTPSGWALYTPGSRTRMLLDQGLAQLDIQPQVALESTNPTVLRQMAVLGYARTVLPQQVAASGEGSLVEGPLVALRSIEGAWRANTDLDPRAQKLMTLVT